MRVLRRFLGRSRESLVRTGASGYESGELKVSLRMYREEFGMLGRLGLAAVAITYFCAQVPSARAQLVMDQTVSIEAVEDPMTDELTPVPNETPAVDPLPPASIPLDTSVLPEKSVAPAISSEAPCTEYCTQCDFDPYQHMADSKYRVKHLPLRAKAHGLMDSLRLGELFGHEDTGDGLGGDGEYCDFECANCYGKLDIEKRIIYSYAADKAQGRPTRAAYGDANTGQVGAEFLPCVLIDGSEVYFRWGFTALFNYSNFEGNRTITLQSERSGTQLNINDGVSYGFILGPTWRADFEIFHVRMSPNFTVGGFFDWVTVREIPPEGTEVLRVDTFKFAGFDFGGYVRGMMDFPITKHINISVGMEYKFLPTDVMMDDDDYRKHLGFVIGLNHEF